MTSIAEKARSGRPAKVLLPQAVEELAASHPNTTWAIVPRDAELKTGWRHFTYGELSHMVNGMARWVESCLGIGHGDEVVGYMGVNDLRYGVVEIALMKAGYKAFLPATRNSPEGQASLVEGTKCRTLLHSEGVDKFVGVFREHCPGVQRMEVPSFDELLQQGLQGGHFPSHQDDDEYATALVLHTSGSTGLPKPIFVTNGGLAVHKTMLDFEHAKGRRNLIHAFALPDTHLLTVAPFYHAMGALTLAISVLCKRPLVVLPAEKPPNAQLIIDVLQQTRPSAAILPPFTLEQIADSDEGIEVLGMLDYVFFGGAPLATETGDKICNVTTVVSIIGSTEAGLYTSRLAEDKNDWAWFEWTDEAGIDMQAEDGVLAELVFKPVEKYKYAQGIFFNFPEEQEWRTKDYYQPHSTKPNLWKFVGRKDDVIVLSNGEKHNPVSFEKILEGVHQVEAAMVVGQGRFQTALIIEPAWTTVQDYEPGKLLDELWPYIEAANADCPSHARVWKSKVAFARKDKPFKRTPKGSIVRSQTVQLYEPEIEALYSNENSDQELGNLDADADLPTTTAFLRKVFKVKEMAIPDDAPGSADIFSYGIDSLSVLALTTTLNHARGARGAEAVSPRNIYQYPTIESLAMFLQGGSAKGGSRQEVMAKMLDKYTLDLPTPRTDKPLPPLPPQHTVILTGSTGSLGNSMLEDMIASPLISRVYCLNRSTEAEVRQRASFEARGAAPDFSKVTFMHTDFGKNNFGLSREQHTQLLQETTILIHNAWAVDFNKSLQSYESVHIAGTRRCVDFSRQSKHGAHIVFISSIASVGNWHTKHLDTEAVPEQLYEDHDLPLLQGYGESKHVASLILARAAKASGVPSTIVRCGQLAGPRERGQIWNKHEWLPSIVLSSKAIGFMPEQLGNQDTVDWVPIDEAARSVLNIAVARTPRAYQDESSWLATAHLVNPRTTSWSKLVPSIVQTLKSETGHDVRAVPFEDWLQRLSDVPQSAEEAERVPGIKLLDFYRALVPGSGSGMPTLATSETAKLSSTVANMHAVDAELMDKWVTQWR